MADNPGFDASEDVSYDNLDKDPSDNAAAPSTEVKDVSYATIDKNQTDTGKEPTTDVSGGATYDGKDGNENRSFDAESGSHVSNTTDGTRTANINMEAAVPDGPHAGMGKEAVMQYSNTPFWRALRWTLLLLLVAGWLGLLGGSIGIIATSPRCLPWWQTSVIYQIYPRSFLDGNETTGEGIGDFAGIREKLDYISDLGVGAILLNSIYKSPDYDFGYDVSDFMDVNENFGTMDEFQALVDEAHDKGLKVILDFVPNQASIEGDLFIQSQDGDEDWADAFTWEESVPNNWLSVYGNSSWSRDEARNEYYLHQFSKYQPDLNLNSKKVKQYLEDAMDFWFAKGVDGLNIQGTQFMFEDPDLKDEPADGDFDGSANDYDSLKHDYTVSYEGVHKLLNNWREGIFFQYSTAGTYRLMMTDVNTNTTDQSNYYGTGDNPEADLPQNYNLFLIGDANGDGGSTTGTQIVQLVEDWVNKIPGKWPSFQLGNHEVRRIASRLSSDYVKAANMLLLTLPGTPICYYGDEIGMVDTQIDTYDDVQDIKGKSNPDNWAQLTRDPERGPMQWNDSDHGGFSKADHAWLPVADNYGSVNVELQSESKFSNLGVFKTIVAFRSDNRALLSKKIRILEHESDITAYIRSSEDQNEQFLVMINFGSEDLESDVYNNNEGVPLQGEVRVATHDGRDGEIVELNKLELAGGEGLIIQLD